MAKAIGYAAYDPKKPLAPFSFDRREPGAQDVQIEILYCGICHSDLHHVEVIAIRDVNEAYERLLESDVKYRFAIDMASLKAEEPREVAAARSMIG